MTYVRITPETAKCRVLEIVDSKRETTHIRDLPDTFVRKFIKAQETWWTMQAALAEHLDAGDET